jgi:gluconate kinase
MTTGPPLSDADREPWLAAFAAVADRLAARCDHFMPAGLLSSQFATIEPSGPDEDPITLGLDRPAEEIAEPIVGVLCPSTGSPSSSCNLRGTT